MLLSEKQNLYAVNKWSTFSEVLQICGNLCLFLRKSAGTFIPIFSRNLHFAAFPKAAFTRREYIL